MLKVENLSFSVNEKGAELNILSDISFDVKKGEMLVITDLTEVGNRLSPKC